MVTFPAGSGGFLNPQKIIDSLEIEKGSIIADFGCGHGYFTFPLARRVGEEGKVFALDVLPEALEAVNSRMKIEGVKNITIKRCNLEKEKGSGLPDESCDIILMANLLFQTENDQSVIQEAKRVLKKEGKVIFIDWQENVPLGPQGKRVKQEEVKELFFKEGFSFEKDFPVDNYHFGFIFKKQ
ncbi:MAG TPA: class I SAM-dependent methyltransferase [Candidatus Pacearchaeota archaeon]|nr:class I SAM-dependent methyltransferase [Candidatus Pacearchaeota archaeon]HOK94014.1 class I SAM-dependent methyltransferase [Candidatus Pacearchaeota archaeon]HPO75085.1 class I SAM-dependent methyltransferase [Candidatus Pacearchaeota archaeon]